ncbi:MAG: hypothetical protein RLY71_3256 [Pseudomonadota bacterium]|jgi:hypothetical protein
MRPRGEIRQALRAAFERMAPTPATWREAAAGACVGYAMARQTVGDMVRAGELVAVDPPQRLAHSRRPMSRYRLAAPAVDQAPQQGLSALAQALRGWPSAPGAGSPTEGGGDVDA